MKVDFIQEPELEFGSNQKHVDIRYGLMNYGPMDYESPLAPREIKLGVVGTSGSVESICAWLERCRNEIEAKTSNQPTLFTRFPGFNTETAFRSTLNINSKLHRYLSRREVDKMTKSDDYNYMVSNAVDLCLAELEYLAKNTPCDVLLCAVPLEILIATALNDPFDPKKQGKQIRLDFHDLLKAKAMKLGKPTQIILPTTYSRRARQKWKKALDQTKQVQDESTIAWNIHTALYYKANGVPWRLVRDTREYATCYIGICFYKSLDLSTLQTSVAQVFNERGDGVIIKGGTVQVSKEDRQPHLDEKGAYNLLNRALNQYRQEHGTLPARVVIHKTSRNNEVELDGFHQALSENNISFGDFLYLSQAYTRLFRYGEYPPLRGTFWNLDDRTNILYTTGSVEFFRTYPGMYIPRPLQFECNYIEQSPRFLSSEILALTKMNWNDTQFDGMQPITLRAAHQVSSVLKYVDEGDSIESSYRYYM